MASGFFPPWLLASLIGFLLWPLCWVKSRKVKKVRAGQGQQIVGALTVLLAAAAVWTVEGKSRLVVVLLIQLRDGIFRHSFTSKDGGFCRQQ
jgi:hypothetical protein